MKLQFLLLSLFALGSYQPRSSNRPLIIPVIPHIERSISSQSVKADYITFSDRFTAEALSGWPPNTQPRLAPIHSQLLCPWSKSPGPRGYSIQVRVDTLRKTHAIARYEISCERGFRGGFATGELLRLELRDGRWYVAKVLDSRIT